MADDTTRRHLLTGFPDAAIEFLLAIEDDRRRIGLEHGLTAVELMSLLHIAEAGVLTPKQLAANMALTSGAITGIATRLVETGFLQRSPHPHDRRSRRLELTDSGHRMMSQIHSEFESMVTAATEGLGEEGLAIAIRSLHQVTGALRARVGAVSSRG